ncbi:LysR family transcriptional regulator [Achromobacter denitrificans]|uniref:LysR family transcriptional regulator n=1 Tax=Achromobacter denitrificans TaxID=32002 RepID=A0ABZ3G6P8_ACHDE|nr:LysR family transcriptional regulator [Achromobacter denitrificans]ASC68217.1 LysR family transcriptional regulator [Achromobacter denitrificans]QCS66448.1 LysR family transcriptional regulator [Achromobacter denitrificans]RSE75521.1 LysR family transcriptional regulator [Achromobacter denitrificans]CAB3913631.1 HTH-type transcriptional regulator DmlR [Achromobacter denitrificans]
MIPSERLKGIEAFVCTADAGSFTAAAERLNLSASAVGKSVARLEARLNARLFERSTRRLALTDAGRAFYGTCARVLEELQDAEAMLAAERREPAGRLRIDLPATFGRLKALPLLLDFFRRHPRLRPQLSFTDRFVDLMEEGIDVAVRIGGPDRWAPGLGRRYLGSERVVFCASPDYLARRGAPLTVDALPRHDAVAYGRADGEAPAWRIAQEGGPARLLPVEGAVLLDSAEAQVEAVAAGCGIAQLATWLAADALRDGRVVEVLPQLAAEGLPLFLAWPLKRESSPKVDAVLRVLGESLRID